MGLILNDCFNIDESVWIAPSSIVLGDVTIGRNSSVWFQCLLRGDTDKIIIGEDCNIQDGSIIHNMEDYPVTIGNRVSFGHGVLAHGCTIADDVLVGIRATILNGVQIGEHCLIAAGTLIPENKVIPPYSLVMGSPGKVIKEVTPEHIELIHQTAINYVKYSREYKAIMPHWQPLVKNS